MKLDKKVVSLAITGASGACYGIRLLECLLLANIKVYLMISSPAKVVIATETELDIPGSTEAQKKYFCERFGANPDNLQIFTRDQWMAPVASGSNAADAMVVCPCSTGTLSAISSGTSRTLIERAADVMLKEQRPLILVPREAPLSAVHLENMLKLARLGVTILPASPAFYHKPDKISGLVDFIVARILDHLGVEQQLTPRWGD